MRKFINKHKKDAAMVFSLAGLSAAVITGLCCYLMSDNVTLSRNMNDGKETSAVQTNTSNNDKNSSENEEDEEALMEELEKKSAEWEASRRVRQDKPIYIADTTASSDTDISMDVFRYPFVNPDSKYSYRNTDFLKADGAENEYAIIKAMAEDYTASALSFDYKVVSQDKQQYIDNAGKNVDDASGGFFDVDGNVLSHDELMDESADWIINNEVQADATFKTDKSLIWSDLFYIYLRGELTISPHHIKDGEETYWPGTFYGLDYRNGGKYVVDFRISTYNEESQKRRGFNSHMISDFMVLGKIPE